MLTISIGGTDRTSNVVLGTVKRTDVLNQQVDTLDFKIRRYGSLTFVPALGQTVSMVKDGTTLFGGIIMRVIETVEASKIITYTVSCNDYSQYLKRKIVSKRYENQTVAAIISDLVATYTSDGFTTANVQGALTIKSIAFSRLTVAECLQKLADAISYVWYVDYVKDVHFFPRNGEAGPALSDTSGNYIYDSLRINEDLSQIRNSVTVQGGEAVSASTRTETFNGDGTKTQFPLTNKFSSLPSVTVGGVARTVGVDNLDADGSYQCMWNFNQKSIRFTAGNVPASGANNIEVTGYYLYPIVVRVPAPSSIAAYGEYGFSITDKSIRSQDEAIARATAELQSYQNALNEGAFRTYSDGFRAGQIIRISSIQRSKTIDVLIQSVRATMRDTLGDTLEYEVQFATLKSIGIIEYLQAQLRSKEVIVDDDETLLNYLANQDTITGSDSILTPTKTTGPYTWDNFNWGYGVWG